MKYKNNITHTNTTNALILFIFSTLPLLLNAPAYCQANINIAEQHLAKEQYKQAAEAYTTLIKSIDSIPALHYGRGVANYHLAALDSAIADFTRAIELDNNTTSTSQHSFIGLAGAYILTKQHSNAAKVLTKKIATDTTTNAAELLYCRAITQYMDGNYAAAAKDFGQTITLLKHTTSTTYHYAIYGKAIANYKLKNYANSKTDLEDCITKAQIDADYIAECQKLLAIIKHQ